MPQKYSIEVSPAPSRFLPIGKYVVERSEACINCGRCATACIYRVHQRCEEDPRFMADPVDYLCKGCFRCLQECPKEALTIRKNKDYLILGDPYWTPEILSKNWYQAETGKIPVSGAGYTGPFSGEGFDSMWTDMSEIVRPTRDGIHGREYISTSVDIGRKVPVIKFDEHGNIATPLPPSISIPLPIVFDVLPFGRYEQVYEAIAGAASHLGTLMIVDPDEWLNMTHSAHVVPVLTRLSENLLKTCTMVEVEYNSDVLNEVNKAKRARPTTIVSVRVPFQDEVERIVEELAYGGVEVIHLYADNNGREIDAFSQPRFIKEPIREVHRHLVELNIRDTVTLMVGGGIALPEHVAKAILCGADVTAIDLPLLIALECSYCKDCCREAPCPRALEEIDPRWGAQRIINLISAWRNQLLEVLGAMGLREVRRLRGELGRAIFCEDIENEAFKTVFVKEVECDVKAKN